MNARTRSTPTPTPRASRFAALAPFALAGAALLAMPALTACDGSAPGVVLASDTADFAFTDVEQSNSATFRLSIASGAVSSITAASLGVSVDVVAGGPAIEVSVTPPGGSAMTTSASETVTSSGVTYDRYSLTLGDVSTLCPGSGACTLDFALVISRDVTGLAFDATATVSGVITGEPLSVDDLALDFL